MSARAPAEQGAVRGRPLAPTSRLRQPPVLLLPAVYLAALAVGEVVTTFVSARAGMVVHGAVLAAVLVEAAVTADVSRQRFLLAFTLAPMVRILSLSLPLQHVQLKYWYIIDAVPWVAGGVMVARSLRLDRRTLGLTVGALPLQLAIASTGIGLGLMEYAILRPQPLIPRFSWQAFWLPALILFVGTGLTEEFIFRGVMLSAFRRLVGRFTVLYVSIVFMVLHTGYRSGTDLVFVFGVGLLYTWCVSATGSILGAALSHGIANICLYLVVPFISVAGLTAVPPHGTALRVRQPEHRITAGDDRRPSPLLVSYTYTPSARDPVLAQTAATPGAAGLLSAWPPTEDGLAHADLDGHASRMLW